MQQQHQQQDLTVSGSFSMMRSPADSQCLTVGSGLGVSQHSNWSTQQAPQSFGQDSRATVGAESSHNGMGMGGYDPRASMKSDAGQQSLQLQDMSKSHMSNMSGSFVDQFNREPRHSVACSRQASPVNSARCSIVGMGSQSQASQSQYVTPQQAERFSGRNSFTQLSPLEEAPRKSLEELSPSGRSFQTQPAARAGAARSKTQQTASNTVAEACKILCNLRYPAAWSCALLLRHQRGERERQLDGAHAAAAGGFQGPFC